MSSPTKHRAASTNSGRTRNDESSHARKLSDSQHGMGAGAGKPEGGKKARSPLADKKPGPS